MRTRETSLMRPVRADYYSSPNHLVTWDEEGQLKRIVDCEPQRLSLRQRLGGILPYRPVQIDHVVKTARPLAFRLTAPGGFLEHGTWFPDKETYPQFQWNPPIDDAVATFCVNSAIATSKTGSWDALTSIGEARETIKMIGNTANRLFNAADNIADLARRMKRRPGQTVLDVFSNLWLEGRYGWRPLFSEVDSMARALAERDWETLRKEGHSKVVVPLEYQAPDVVQDAGRAIFTYTARREGTRTYRGFALSVGSIGTVDYKPVSTAWELVTLSFVVDRFIDIGSAITAFSPIPGVDTPCSGFSVQDEWTVERTVSIDPAPGYSLEEYTQGRLTFSTKSYNRTPRSAQFPRLYPRLDKSFLVDLGSLAYQRYGRILQRLIHS